MNHFNFRWSCGGFGLSAMREHAPRRRGRELRPELERCESRRLLNAAGGHSDPGAEKPTADVAVKNPLAPYRIFIGTIKRGPHAGTTFQGPIVLGDDGRIQVNGYFYPKKGGVDVVVGQITVSYPALRIDLPGGSALEATGNGYLQAVRGGLPGGYSLVGHGNLSGPAGADFGTWVTVAPSKVPGSL